MRVDGYLRLTIPEFNALRLTHCWSVPDDDVQAELVTAGLDSKCGGYTEWMGSRDSDPVTVGWTWYESSAGRFEMAPRKIGAIGTNLMLVGAGGEDLGRGVTDDFLRSRIATMQWQQSVQSGLDEH
ncbi:DUF4902 domain-containing protein [Paraburkholderia jirisanensis]